MKLKSEAKQHILDFVKLVETQFQTHIKVILSDNGLEFQLPSFNASKGITHQVTCIERPQQNGIVERKQ